ncbi:LysR family transcriptional regulator [Thioflexithrix psekupsensis]|uniref:HTH lysR-type domain-containing protein n=1 Tax=Thioflexithrix psekupsensis TaxID=1570016 RepID=A0A251XB70_9GAMM|nr:LysR family transcriptional regulator [Thioflexithrix psekupsensis]OUD15681.1 hypothetical protein TPSD3_03975 [Thioflexithrix psekupsensis]
MKILSMMWLHREGKNFLGPKRFELLKKIHEYGSLSKAAQALGFPYKSAWDMIEKMNQLSPTPLVCRARGGKEKGGTELTPFAMALLEEWAQLEQEHRHYLTTLESRLMALENRFLATFSVENRNEYCRFEGIIQNWSENESEWVIYLDVSAQNLLTVTLNKTALNPLILEKEKPIVALIPITSLVLLPKNVSFGIYPHNCFSGEIIEISYCQASAQVMVSVDQNNWGKISLPISHDTIKQFNLKQGDAVNVLFDTHCVFLATHLLK